MMKKLFYTILAVVVMMMISLIALPCEAAQKVVAIMPIKNNVNTRYSSVAAKTMTDELINVFVNSGMYTVVERGQLDQVIGEMGFSSTGMVDSNSVIEIGKLSGAQYILVGNVSMADVYQSVIPLTTIKTFRAKVGMIYRLIDAKTGKILLSSSIEDQHTIDEVTGSDFSEEVLLHKACSNVAEKILKEIQKKNPVIGNILDVNGEEVYIDLGTDSGLRVGETLMVFKEGAPIYGKNGEIVTTRIIELGEIKVTQVEEGYSIGKIKEKNNGIVKDALVKRVIK